MRARPTLTVSIAAAAAILLLGRVISGLYVDYQWYAAMGAASLWRTRLAHLALLRGSCVAVATAFVFLNLYAVRHSVVSLVLPRRVANLEIGEEVPSAYLVGVAALLSIIIGTVLGFAQHDWMSLLLARDGQLFREQDPYFLQDLGFFVYWLPLESSLHVWALIVLLAVATLVVLLYALTPSLRWERGALHVSAYVRRHLTVLGALLLALLAWSYRLDAYTLLIEGTGPDAIFTSTDHRVGIPVNLLLAFIAAAAALLVLWTGWTGQIRVTFGAVTAVLVLSVVLRQLLPPLVQRASAPADPAVRESDYLRIRALYTRRAYGLDRIIPTDSTAGFADSRAAVQAVALWDPAALWRAVVRAKAPGLASGDIGWRTDAGRLVADVVEQPIVPASVESAAAPTPARAPWLVTRTLPYTTDPGGGLAVSDRTGGEYGTLPAALVHEGARGYLIAPDRTGEALRGQKIDAWGARLALAWDQQDLRLLFRDIPQPNPTVMLRRDVRERLRAIAPFFAQGRQITPIVHRDSLLWVVHLYAISDFYPLGERLRLDGAEIRYLRHAATAVVEGATGKVTIVADSVLDPVSASWTRRFPELFSTREALPREVLRAIPPAIDGAIVQAVAFARAGLRGDVVTPAAHLPRITGSDTLFSDDAPTLFAAPDGRGVTAWSTPVLDSASRVRGLIVSYGGGESETHWHPFASYGPRWQEVIERLQRSADTGLTPARDGRLVRGRVRAIPTHRGAAYVQTSFIWRTDGAPAVAQVAVVDGALFGDSLGTGRTLADATGATHAIAVPALPPATLTEFRARVAQLYAAMRDALSRGDWRAFGSAYDELGRLLRAAPR